MSNSLLMSIKHLRALTLAFIASWSALACRFTVEARTDNVAECLLASRTSWFRIYRSFPTRVGLGSERLDKRKARRVQSSTCVPCAILQGRVTPAARVFLTGCRLG